MQVEEVLAALEELDGSAVAQFSKEPWSAPEAHNPVLTSAALAELDRAIEQSETLDAALADFDFDPSDEPNAGAIDLTDADIAEIEAYDEAQAARRRETVAARRAQDDAAKAASEAIGQERYVAVAVQNYANDLYRKTPEGKAARNEKDRARFVKKKKDAGKGDTVRAYGVPDSEEKQAKRNERKRLSKQRKLDAMTPEELKAYRDENARKEKERRDRNKTKVENFGKF